MAAGILLAAAVLPGRLSQAFAENTAHQQQDFGIFHRSARCLASQDCDPYEVQQRSAPNLAPPHAHLLIWPLQGMAREAAYSVWIVISICVLGAVLVQVSRELQLPMSPGSWAVMVALLVSSGAMMSLVSSGQIYAVMAWPITAAWRAWRRGQLDRAGLWLGAAASIKVMLLLPALWFLVRGRWRAAFSLLAAFALFTLTGLLVFGPGPYAAWLRTLSHAPIAGHFRDGALLAALTRTLDYDVHFAALVAVPWIVRPMWACLSGLIVAVTIIRPTDADRSFLAVMAASTLTAPIGWIYAIWWFIGPAAAVWCTSVPAFRALLIAAAVLLWLPDTAPLWGQPHPLLTAFWGSMFFWVWLILWSSSALPPARSVRT